MKTAPSKRPRPLWLHWLFCLIPLAVAGLLYWLLPHFPAFTEQVFSRGLFRAVTFPLEWLVSLLPFSLTEGVILLAAPVLLTLLGVWIRRLCRRPHKGRTAERGCRFVAWCLSLAALLYMFTCGANFSRRPLGELLELPTRQYTAAELQAVCVDLADKASALREELPEDENGCMALSASVKETLARGPASYEKLRNIYPFLRTATWRVKPVTLSHYWSYTGYTGLYCPWLGEANVNVDIPPCDIAHTVAHELGHTAGFAKEKECNFLSYLVCVESGNPEDMYSGYLVAYIYCSNALYAHSKAMWNQVFAHCSPAMRRDLVQRNSYWKQFEGPVKESSQKVNDTFIKANGVESGRLSYSEMVELVLRYYDKMGWLPSDSQIK